MIRPLEQLLRAGLHRLPAETAHRLTIRLIRMAPPVEMATSERVRTRLCGLALPHPVGLAAGFDKDAVAVDGLLRLGFAFVETGTSTLRPQAGNPRPRLFRLREDEAVINRMGFNNAGLDRYLDNLRARRGQGIVGGPGIVGGNVGINKDSSTPLDDYARALSRTAPLVDYVTINVSSPNTPGLRKLQAASALAPLLERLAEARSPDRPVLLKIAPDLHGAEIDAITDLAIEYRIDGMIVSNTTVARPESLRSAARTEAGGLSGRPLMDPSTEVLRQVAFRSRGAPRSGGCRWCVRCFRRLSQDPRLLACPSGIELVEIGHRSDVEMAAQLDASTHVPELIRDSKAPHFGR